MTDFEFQKQLADRDAGLDYASRAKIKYDKNGKEIKAWTPAINTDIRRTLVANWPASTRDAVYARLARDVNLGTALPKGPVITTHRGGVQ